MHNKKGNKLFAKKSNSHVHHGLTHILQYVCVDSLGLGALFFEKLIDSFNNNRTFLLIFNFSERTKTKINQNYVRRFTRCIFIFRKSSTFLMFFFLF